MDNSLGREYKYNRRRRRSLFLAIIMFFSAVTLCTTSYLVGRTVQNFAYFGRLIDTIILSPGNSVRPAQTTVLESFAVSGNVIFEDGTVYSNGLVELHSTPRYTTTDANGYFLFENVEPGDHTISAVENGVPIAECKVTVQRSAQVTEIQTIQLENGNYLVQIPIKISSLQIVLKIINKDNDNDSDDKIMSIETIKSINPTPPPTIGSKTSAAPSNPIRSPGSSSSATYRPTNSPASSTTPGATPGATPSYSPSPNPTPSVTATPLPTPSSSAIPGSTPSASPSPSNRPSTGSTPSAGNTPNLNVNDDYTYSTSVWTQQSSVDIFSPRPGNSGVRMINGEKVLAPGATGKYNFRLQNPGSFDIQYTIKLSDSDYNTPKLPMKYRLAYGFNDSDYVGTSEWKSASEISLDSSLLSAGQATYFTLEWKWDSGNDAADTAIGTQKGSNYYIININISAEAK